MTEKTKPSPKDRRQQSQSRHKQNPILIRRPSSSISKHLRPNHILSSNTNKYLHSQININNMPSLSISNPMSSHSTPSKHHKTPAKQQASLG